MDLFACFLDRLADVKKALDKQSGSADLAQELAAVFPEKFGELVAQEAGRKHSIRVPMQRQVTA